jgi:hypothetical protein
MSTLFLDIIKRIFFLPRAAGDPNFKRSDLDRSDPIQNGSDRERTEL